ncbi:MAG: hypothetical protein M1819_000726 [Sarea resinae]|nr:MAG: hypothetical protein M1819_000726 [Sarea resinae]
MRHTQSAFGRVAVRNASTTTETAQAASQGAAKAQATASSAASKASEGFSKVTAAAGPAITGAAKGLTTALGRVGGRTGRFINFAQSLVPPTIYYSKVGLELSKLVFESRKMSPPSIATFQTYLEPLTKALKHPANFFTYFTTTTGTLQPTNVLQQVRNLNKQQLASAGVVAAEVVGFFTVGEMLGRMKVVGYRGDTGAHH